MSEKRTIRVSIDYPSVSSLPYNELIIDVGSVEEELATRIAQALRREFPAVTVVTKTEVETRVTL